MTWEFNNRANLISYLGIPGDSTVQTVLGPLGDNAQSIIGEGNAAMQLDDETWVGSLQKIDPTSGYWLILNAEEPMDTIIQYIVEFQIKEPVTVKSGKKIYDLFSKGKFAWVDDNEEEFFVDPKYDRRNKRRNRRKAKNKFNSSLKYSKKNNEEEYDDDFQYDDH